MSARNRHSRLLLSAALWGLLIFLAFPSKAQARQASATESRLEELRKEIAEEERLLTSAENNERKSLSRLKDLNRQLSLREELLRTYGDRIDRLKYERDSLQTATAEVEVQLDALGREYKNRASHAYKYGRQHDAALIFSASSINQMLVRIGYLRRFSTQRRGQLDGLHTATSELAQKRTEMQRKLVENEVMLNNVDKEQENLDDLLGKVRSQIKEIRQEKSTRTDTLAEKRGLERDLVAQIQSLLASRKTRGPASTLPSSEALTSLFAASKSLLPWPTEGTITEPFGDIVHPEFGTKTPNPGILVATEASAEVRSVFAGTVTTIDIIPDMGRFAIVEHGGFHTVYGNLSLFYVGAGDEIPAGHLLGRAGTEAEPRGQAVFFAIFRNGNPENPMSWLRK